MKENTDINVDVVPDYASFLARNDIKGVYVNGTTGEGVYSLTIDERLALAEAWVKEKANFFETATLSIFEKFRDSDGTAG